MALALSVTPSARTYSEHELVAAVRRGDDRAFEILYSRYCRRIASYIHGMVGDHGRAEDLTQEVFISVVRRLRATDGPIMFKPWLYEVAKNACIDEFRRARRGQEVPLEQDDDLVGGNPRLVARMPTPETAIESKQKLAHLKGAFRGLSESHHKVIVLRELEGLSYAQIGEQLGMSQAVVESTLFRARRRLGEEYDDLVSGRRCERVRAVIDEGEVRTMRSLGIKERRLIARHLSHCQPCRRHARLAGVEESLLEQPRLAGKLAALLPIPAWLRLRRGPSTVTAPSHSVGLLQSAQRLAAANPAAFGGFGRAAAAVTLVIAGAGTGIVSLVPGAGSSAQTPRFATPAAVAFGGSRSPHAISSAARIVGKRTHPAARHSTNAAAPPSVAQLALSVAGLAAPRSGSSAVDRARGQDAGASGAGPNPEVATGSAAPSGGTASPHGTPTVRVPSATIGLPGVTTLHLPGVTNATVTGISGPIKTGSLPITATGRTGTAANPPVVSGTVDSLGAGITSGSASRG